MLFIEKFFLDVLQYTIKLLLDFAMVAPCRWKTSFTYN